MGRHLRSPPLLLGIAYLALMPIFATVYASLPPRSFYDSNGQREKGVYQDAGRLTDSLTRAIKQHLRSDRWHVGHNVLQLDPRAIEVHSFEYAHDGHLLFSIEGNYHSIGHGKLISGAFSVWVEPLLRDGIYSATVLNRKPEVGVVVGLTVPGGSALEEPKPNPVNPPISLLFPVPHLTLPSSELPAKANGTFLMPAETYNQLRRLYIAADGDPFYASGLWPRMFYLSVATATTLGFGDISPVSTTARLWVTLEAVLGVVVVGLFLSALAIRVRGSGPPL